VRVWPLSVTHLVKLGCVLVPLAANLTCIALVLLLRARLHRMVQAARERQAAREALDAPAATPAGATAA